MAAPELQDVRPTSKDFWQGFPEAPFSDTFKWLDAEGYEHMLTIRGWEGGAMLKAVERAKEFIAAQGGKPVRSRPADAPAPTPDPAVKIALEEGNKQMAAELQEAGLEIPPAPAGKQYQVSDIAFVKILPQPGDRINIEFYSDDRKTPHNDFPSIKATKYDVGRAMGLLKHVTSADVTKPAEFMCRCKVYWTEGKEYKKADGGTGHYRDIHHVRPA
jgi:hypothetical protein